MLIQELIRKKRDGAALSDADIGAFVAGVTDNSVSDAQIAAFAMAVCVRGMNAGETAALTAAMRDSGAVLSWDGVGRPVVDKHSTGGVGDCVSLALAPMAAAAGLAVPMISGRGLGHSGGTLDKLDSIPGYNTAPDRETFRRVVREAGCAVIGQTGDLAPADKRIYAVRDISGTVESAPLITASILSKKLASGIGALVMDVKCGNGAFAATADAADELAASITATARRLHLPAAALITDMNQPLAPVAGNALEVALAVRYLRGDECPPRFAEVVTALAAEMLLTAGVAATADEARTAAGRTLASGAAAEVFAGMVRALGGAADFVERFERQLPAAPVVRPVFAGEGGYVGAMDTRALGVAVITLGGGRRRAEDAIDHRVGLANIAAIGEAVDGERPVATVHAADEDAARRAAEEVRAAFHIVEDAPPPSPVILRRLGAAGGD
ncbi:MAG: thymidine phosphorylase [Gammaproteobacteria bacterium]|nr:thymidine phosphorylase [Gammaproteobacteria bacterium]